MGKHTVRIDFEPIGKRIESEAGITLLQAAQEAGLEIVAVCGGMGTCEHCRVQVMTGEYSPLTQVETSAFTPQELQANYRLACQAKALSSGKVHIPPEALTTPQRLQLEGLEAERPADRPYTILDIDLDVPDLDDLRSDSARLHDHLLQLGIPTAQLPYPLLKTFSEVIRDWDWKCRVVVKAGQVIAILPAGKPVFGLAVDIGTTKVAAYLLDLETGATVHQSSAMNPQIHYGEDVVSRIFYCMEHDTGRKILQNRIADTINNLVGEMCAGLGGEPGQVVEAVVVGNTAMHHLFAGLPVKQLGLLPFVPAVSEPVTISTRELNLNFHPSAQVYLPANIAGYVGADHVAMMLATGAYRTSDTVMAVDIGTNTEISLVHEGRIYCCSCASGPAFEGAHIRDGMRAAAGAIERVQIDGEAVRLFTIGGQPPVGICGSGILDAIAEMVKAGILNRKGAFSPDFPGVRRSGKLHEFVLARAEATGSGRDITINSRDIHEILLAKAAIRTGIEILLIQAGIEAGHIDRFIVAGAFGTYLDLASAITIRMFPNLPMERFSQVGNAAGAGARMLLLSDVARQEAGEFARRMEYVELTIHPQFKSQFLDAMDFRMENLNETEPRD